MSEAIPNSESFGPASPEEGREPRYEPFNPAAMADEEVALLAQVLGESAKTFFEAPGQLERSNSTVELWHSLCDGLVDLVRQDPERGMGIICGLANTDNGYLQETAAFCVPGLSEFNYRFAVHLAVFINGKDATDDGGMPGETACAMVWILSDRSVPDEYADQVDAMANHGAWPIYPKPAIMTPDGIVTTYGRYELP